MTLDQMLIALFPPHPGRVRSVNMNRSPGWEDLVHSGEWSLSPLPRLEARKIVLAQSSDWNAYRSKLAGISAASPAKSESRQEVGGKVTAKVEDKEDQAAPKDQLKRFQDGIGCCEVQPTKI